MKKLLLIFLMSYLLLVTLSAQIGYSEGNPVIIDFGNKTSFEQVISFSLQYGEMVYFKLIGDYSYNTNTGNPNRAVIAECLRDENYDFTLDIKVNGQWVELDDDDGMNNLPKAAFYHSALEEKLIRIRPYNYNWPSTPQYMSGAILFRAYCETVIYLL